MNEQQARVLLQALRAKQIGKNGHFVTAGCPLAPWTHNNGTDSNPSFGISIKEGEKSFFHCYSCRSGPVMELVNAMQLYQQTAPRHIDFDFATAMKVVTEEANTLVTLPGYTEFDHAEEHPMVQPWPKEWIESFTVAHVCQRAIDYMLQRGIPYITCMQANLRYDSTRDRLVFPFYTIDGVLAGARGRAIQLDGEPAPNLPHYDYTYQTINNSKLVWYNEQALKITTMPMVVVEGQVDCLKVYTVYPAVMANLTAKPSAYKMAKLGYVKRVILIPDNDATGDMTVARYAYAAQQYGFDLTVAKLPGSVKDAGECHPEFLREHILAYV